MKTKVNTGIYLDTRRKKKDNTFPVKLRITVGKKSKYYTSIYSLTEQDFYAAMESPKPKGALKEIKGQLIAWENRAIDIIQNMATFSFNKFEQKFTGPAYQKGDVFGKYDEYIDELDKNDQISTAANYRCSKKSLLEFLQVRYNLKTQSLPFSEITVKLLEEYESFMLKDLHRSHSTVGIYLRALRTLFNIARDNGEIPFDMYPFGKRKYQIPASSNFKRALKPNEMKKLFQYKNANPFEEKARDFWLLSYLCNGINMRDLAEIKYDENLLKDQIIFHREKTKRTNKTNLKPIAVPLTSEAKKIITKYQNKEKLRGNYVFDILDEGMNAVEKRRAVQNFTRFVNQHIKTLAVKAGLSDEISTYWARHTFATTMRNNGASIELISESIGHASNKTTVNYLSSFEMETKKDFSNKLMDFLK